MTNQSVQPLGPLFGPDFITIEVNDETGVTYALEVFPDANNPALKENKLPTQFYYLPKQVNLAKRLDSPQDYDFSVTLFKGLMTTEDTLGISGIPSTGGEVDAGGAFMTFSTTMAVPDSVVKGALAHLKAKSHTAPPARIASFFLRDSADPDPLLGIVPIVDNNVTIEIPQLAGNDAKSPFFLSAQGAGHGSIEAAGVSSFLVTCNQMAAGAIVGALKEGRSPFTVHYNLKLLFYINACDITMNVDVDKTFTQFSGAAQASYGGFFQADLSANYQSCITSGAISTVIQMNGTDVDPDIKQLINKQVSDMQDKAWNLVKTEIFDWQPKPEDPAKASAGACGGVAVNLKFNYQKHGVHFNDHFVLNQTITKLDTVSGTLNALESGIKKDLNKYLSIVDIGEYFKKIQVAASPNIDFDNDPIQAAYIEVSYPDFDAPKSANGEPQLNTRSEGFHYNATKIDQAAPVTLARWTRENPTDIINIAFLKLDNDLPKWKRDQVKLHTKLVYKPDDARVDLSNGGITIESDEISNDHSPVVGPESVGYIFIKFILDRPIKTPNVSVKLTVQIGNRTDVLQLTNGDPTTNPSADLQIWSDKYFNETVAKVKIDVEVAPPPSDFAGQAVTWSGVQAVPLNLGRIKRIVPYTINVPALTDATQSALVGQYILETIKEMSAVKV